MNYQNVAQKTKRNIIRARYNKTEDCSICCSDMFDKTVLYTPCGHVFHNKCLKKWLETMKNPVTCPCCRSFIPCLRKYKHFHMGQDDPDFDVIFTTINYTRSDDTNQDLVELFQELGNIYDFPDDPSFTISRI